MTTEMTAETADSEALGADAPETTAAPVARTGTGRKWIVAAVLAVAAAGGGAWYKTTLGHETTDDAQLDAEVVAVPARVGGTVAKILFVENQRVKVGDLLATLDDDVAKARLAQAQAAVDAAVAAADAADADARVGEANATGNKAAADASLAATAAAATTAKDQIAEAEAARASAEAALVQAQRERDRNASLFASGAISQASLDQLDTALTVAKANADAARARLVTLKGGVAQAASRVGEASARARQTSDVASLVAQARARAAAAHAQVATATAARDLAALDLGYTRIIAPHDGVVSKKTIAEGQAVSPGQAIVQLVTPGVWVTANFKETQLAHMRAGEPVDLEVDAFPSLKIHGEIESLSGATGSRFTLLPPDNASGNFTKIVQRVPVRIRVTEVPAGVELRPGMSVGVTVDTRG